MTMKIRRWICLGLVVAVAAGLLAGLAVALAGCAAPTPAPATPADASATATATPVPPPSTPPQETLTPTPTPTPTPPPELAEIEPLPWDKLPAPLATLDFDTYPVVDGSTATRPLSQALAYVMTGITDMLELEVLADHTNTDDAYVNLAYGNVDLAIAYEPAETTRDMIRKQAKLETAPIGRDGLVFLVNESNPIEGLTTQQVQDIYQGKITNWKDVGGDDLPIAAFQRPTRSGSQTMMQKLVMGDLPLAIAPSEMVAQEMGDLIRVVSDYRNQANAIGFTVFYYAAEMYMEPGIKIIPIDGVEPSVASIAAGAYPFIHDFYVAVRAEEPEDSPAREMFELLRGETGRQLIEAMGYAGIDQ